ncbi:uncharacterized protein LAESUDRAFT_384552 [Laetiporus sulphureus 93-53]|uniref:Uncharacterized protein n=1 Tax=Laetiporus sulphureus 93-53 TaxID=1314785 RepID=A0A165CMR1_9APHY|nr:uncharacterized protein LAESUDRAFT_384552 [Laetiporus sulphureus 93-53]KZT03093.1 hypothetical protein LAESUDRAFT_384552 [Laetiporus sulphureus 93-53]
MPTKPTSPLSRASRLLDIFIWPLANQPLTFVAGIFLMTFKLWIATTQLYCICPVAPGSHRRARTATNTPPHPTPFPTIVRCNASNIFRAHSPQLIRCPYNCGPYVAKEAIGDVQRARRSGRQMHERVSVLLAMNAS